MRTKFMKRLSHTLNHKSTPDTDRRADLHARQAGRGLPPPTLEAVANRIVKLAMLRIQYFTTDTCTDKKLIKSIFGADVTHRLDIFHWMDRIMGATFGMKHPVYLEFKSRLSQCVFAARPEDVAKARWVQCLYVCV